LQQVGGEGMAEGVTTDALGDAAGPNGLVKGFLDATGMERMTISKIMVIVFFHPKSGKDILPAPIPSGIGVFFGKGLGQWDLTITARSILCMNALDNPKMFLKRLN
jgi:hypothetical protein